MFSSKNKRNRLIRDIAFRVNYYILHEKIIPRDLQQGLHQKNDLNINTFRVLELLFARKGSLIS